MMFESKFRRGDRVIIDGGKDLVARVTGHLFRENYITVELSWVHNGASHTAWIEEWRLEPA